MIAFFDDQNGYPTYSFTEEAETAFGAFLTGDVQTSGGWCLNLLAWIEDVRTGRVPEESWGGNSWRALIDKEGLHLYDQYSDDWEGHYPLPEALRILGEYWRYLASSPQWKQRETDRWEAENGRPHPLRATL